MEIHELEIVIAPDGEMRVEVKGAKGTACLKYTDLLQRIFGEAKSVEHTAEYYEPPTGVEVRLDEKA